MSLQPPQHVALLLREDERIRELEEELAAARQQADGSPVAITTRFIEFVCTLSDDDANTYLSSVFDYIRSRRQTTKTGSKANDDPGSEDDPSPAASGTACG